MAIERELISVIVFVTSSTDSHELFSNVKVWIPSLGLMVLDGKN